MSSPHPPLAASDGSVVAHVVVVGFHAQLGNRIEFSYPRLRGTPILRSPKISDTSDISADVVSPTIVRRNTPNLFRKFDTPEKSSPTPSNRGDWGTLPEEWSFLPFMALPDGVHDQNEDLVFFTLPPDVHCVSCFRQIDAIDAKTHSASSGPSYEQSVAARGSVQKSVVLLCRRPLFGVLADRLVPAVRAYFDQADFARTDVLSSLFHSLNVSLSRPSLNDAPTMFHGLDLRALVRRLGPQTLAVIKLILLERRVIIYSQPVHHASNAIVALASIFPGAMDTIVPNMRPLDTSERDVSLGLPLALFSQEDRISLQPYAPLPLVSRLIPNKSPKACLIGTSHNVGLLLSSTATSAARKAASGKKPSAPLEKPRVSFQQSSSAPVVLVTPDRHSAAFGTADAFALTPNSTMRSESSKETKLFSSPRRAGRGSGGVPVVDALVNLSNGKVSVSGAIEPLCRITRQERRFMRDLMVSAASSSASVTSSGATGSFIGSDDYIRGRLREYILGFLSSIAAVEGVLGGPAGGETWSSEMVDEFDFSSFDPYNERFVRSWMTTRNAAQWARKRSTQSSVFVPPPKPEVDESLLEEPLIPVDRVAAGLSGLRQNVAELGRFSSIVSAKAAEGLSSFFKRIEQEVSKMDSAVGAANNSNQSSPHTPSARLAAKRDPSQESAHSKSAPR